MTFVKITAVVMTLFLFALPVSSASYEFGITDESEIYPTEELDNLFASLPEDVREELQNIASSDDPEAQLEAVKDKLDVSYWVKFVLKELQSLILPTVSGTASLMALVVIAATMKKLLSEGTGRDMCEFSLSVICALKIGEISLEAAQIASSYIGRICAVMNTMLPVMNGVMISSGSLTQMSVNNAALMLYITVAENLMRIVLMPLASALFALGIVSGVFKGVNINSFVSGLKKFLMLLISFSLLLFSFILGIQTSLAKSADTLSMKTVRFALGSYVPIVGGAVSEALTTVSAGLSHVRRVVGVIGIVIILLIVLPTVLSLFLTRLSLIVCKSVSETLECDSVGSVIAEADSVLSLFLAFCAMTGVFFIFAVVLFMNSGLA